ncbi:unnamed protein product [Lactuca virosa]|uniref:HAT C-terminal dimerisation domain-containing protein n=1 Tax=Lactuca virosa TaxID=75947 RepID=A0AAU9LZC2_9ASTR|nr:unnamed protein product [Lactuca virosa]
MASMKQKDRINIEKKRNTQILRSSTVDLSDEVEDEEVDVQEVSVKRNVSKKKNFVGSSNVRGPIDTMFPINQEKTKQITLDKNNPIKEKLKMNVWDKIATWAYSVGLPFNAVCDESFQDMINSIGEYGRGMPAPSYHNICVTLMKKRLEDTQKFVDSFRPHWEEYQCSIMSDFWTDGKGRCLINFLVNCPLGTSIHENRHHIQVLFVSEEWKKSDFAKKAVGKKVERIVARKEFWDNIHLVCKVLAPLVDVVRLVDTEEKPCMGYIYDAMDKAKEQIKTNLTWMPNERMITRVWAMIQTRWTDQLHHPLHAVGCYLNPAIFHGENSREIRKNRDIATGLYVEIDRLVPDNDDNDKLRQDLNLYINSIGQFGSSTAIRARTKVAPYIWWRTYGIDTPLLQTFAITFLSQTYSASPCERNWSAFDNLHSKKSNCLLQQKLNDLVFIQYNTRLQRRFNSLKANRSLDPILLRDVDENDDWVIPTEVELQEFVDGRDGLLWSAVREPMVGTEEVGVTTRSKRDRYRDDDDDDDDIRVEVEDLDEQLDSLGDVGSEEDFMSYD